MPVTIRAQSDASSNNVADSVATTMRVIVRFAEGYTARKTGTDTFVYLKPQRIDSKKVTTTTTT